MSDVAVVRAGPEETLLGRPSRNGHTREVGALVIGGDYQGLGIARSIGKRGFPVCVIDDERSIARFSRYVDRSVRVPDLQDERRAVDALIEACSRLDLRGWVLFPTRDETVAAISRHRDELSEWFRVPTPPWAAVRWAWDKRNTYRLAQELEIPAPRTWYPDDRSELEAIDAELPLVIKPAIKPDFVRVTKQKAWRVDDRSQLEELFARASRVAGEGGVMVQELVPGNGDRQFAYCALFKEGRASAVMLARRLRQHPAEFGRASTFVETVEVPMIEEFSERFLRAIDYYGLVELEYKLDSRDGLYKLLDVNARTWGYHTLGARSGVDFPYLLFADQTGESVPFHRSRSGVRWMRLLTDLPTALIDIRCGRLDWRSYIDSLRRSNTEAVFSLEDPLPGLVELALVPYLFVRRGF